ncbi:MAG: DNA polymerase III subunit delta' [Sphingomonadales bacterium BRH_c3]|nr:MAG: DNA polymerase III subunit delta' [Sphingomonadales bacterium BRH_c3]
MEWPNHATAWAQWRNAMEGARMHHAWILAGKAGIGKHDFALAAARALVAEEGIPQPAGQHPDILILTHLPKDDQEERKRDDGKPFEVKRNIAVSQIRAMQQRLTTRPTLGARRVIIINPADDMERSASNALLKSLEEPPVGTFFLLVTHRPAGLLPTIRSRCRMLRFATLGDAEIAQHLAEEFPGTKPEQCELAVKMSGGSLVSARNFLEQELGAVASAMRRLASQGDPGFELRGQLAAAIGQRPDRDRMRAVLELARTTLAQALPDTDPQSQTALIEAHQELVVLAGQAPTYNFDPGLLAGEIASLLARAAGASEPAHG